MELENLDTIFEKLKNTNEKINNKFNDILNLKLKISADKVNNLYDISVSLNNTLDELELLYYHLLDNDNTKEISIEMKNKIKSIKIMILMKMSLEND
jgi:hypothetical protein